MRVVLHACGEHEEHVESAKLRRDRRQTAEIDDGFIDTLQHIITAHACTGRVVDEERSKQRKA